MVADWPPASGAAANARAAPQSLIRLLTSKQSEQAVGSVVGKNELVVPIGFGGKLGAPGKEGLLILRQRGFDVVGVGGDGHAEFGPVEHGEVGALPREG